MASTICLRCGPAKQLGIIARVAGATLTFVCLMSQEEDDSESQTLCLSSTSTIARLHRADFEDEARADFEDEAFPQNLQGVYVMVPWKLNVRINSQLLSFVFVEDEKRKMFLPELGESRTINQLVKRHVALHESFYESDDVAAFLQSYAFMKSATVRSTMRRTTAELTLDMHEVPGGWRVQLQLRRDASFFIDGIASVISAYTCDDKQHSCCFRAMMLTDAGKPVDVQLRLSMRGCVSIALCVEDTNHLRYELTSHPEGVGFFATMHRKIVSHPLNALNAGMNENDRAFLLSSGTTPWPRPSTLPLLWELNANLRYADAYRFVVLLQKINLSDVTKVHHIVYALLTRCAEIVDTCPCVYSPRARTCSTSWNAYVNELQSMLQSHFIASHWVHSHVSDALQVFKTLEEPSCRDDLEWLPQLVLQVEGMLEHANGAPLKMAFALVVAFMAFYFVRHSSWKVYTDLFIVPSDNPLLVDSPFRKQIDRLTTDLDFFANEFEGHDPELIWNVVLVCLLNSLRLACRTENKTTLLHAVYLLASSIPYPADDDILQLLKAKIVFLCNRSHDIDDYGGALVFNDLHVSNELCLRVRTEGGIFMDCEHCERKVESWLALFSLFDFVGSDARKPAQSIFLLHKIYACALCYALLSVGCSALAKGLRSLVPTKDFTFWSACAFVDVMHHAEATLMGFLVAKRRAIVHDAMLHVQKGFSASNECGVQQRTDAMLAELDCASAAHPKFMQFVFLRSNLPLSYLEGKWVAKTSDGGLVLSNANDAPRDTAILQKLKWSQQSDNATVASVLGSDVSASEICAEVCMAELCHSESTKSTKTKKKRSKRAKPKPPAVPNVEAEPEKAVKDEPPSAAEGSREECIICMSNDKTHAFVPCGHLCVVSRAVTFQTMSTVRYALTRAVLLQCKACATKVSNVCPMCRNDGIGCYEIFSS